MRIISGKRRGALLNVPSGGLVRPTADRVRQGLFNLLMGGRYGKPLDGVVVADVFAGSGALGLEAWSRGAETIVMVETVVSFSPLHQLVIVFLVMFKMNCILS